jgi:hypothetical protein
LRRQIVPAPAERAAEPHADGVARSEFARTQRGIATPKMDVDLIVKRYKEVRERAKNE